MARLLKEGSQDPVATLREYEALRLAPTTRIVLENRTAPPALIIDTVERLTGGQGEAELPVEDDDQRLGQLAQRRRSGLVGAREHRVCLEALVCGQRRWHA